MRKDGEFELGHIPASPAVIVQHPLYPNRDTYGRLLPRDWTPCVEIDRIRNELLLAISPERVRMMTDELFHLIEHGEDKIKLAALNLAFTYFMGKPSVKMEIKKASAYCGVTPEQMQEMLKAASLE